MPNFTKGPWLIDKEPGRQDCFIIAREGTGFGVCSTILKEEVDKSNAHLIAAAPEMYAMLEELECSVLSIEQTTNNKLYQKLIRELLAKARGEYV